MPNVCPVLVDEDASAHRECCELGVHSDNFRADVFAKGVKCAAAKAKPSRRADLARIEFHDLRHTFASLMIAAGANPLQLAEALGHSDANGRPDPTLVWTRYGHLYPGSAREAAAAT